MSMEYKEFIFETLKEAAEIAKKNFGKVSGIVKKDDTNQVLTETDVMIGKNIVDRIKKAYPKHNVIDEETGVINNRSLFTWVIDPIDGTSHFISGLPFFGTQIALLKDDLPIVGGLNLPFFEEIYFAERSIGTFCNGKRIKVSNETELVSILASYGIDSHKEEPEFTIREMKVLGEIVSNIRNLRVTNSCYDAAMVASGKLGAYLHQSMKIWDIVPLQIVIEEAGGVVTDFYGRETNYKNHLNESEEHFTFCAASPILHKQLQEIIHKSITRV